MRSNGRHGGAGRFISLASRTPISSAGSIRSVRISPRWIIRPLRESSMAGVLKKACPTSSWTMSTVAFAVGAALAIGFVIPLGWLRWAIAGVLVSLGALGLFRHRHPRWAGMRVSMAGLAVWSFLMATAHGAGLMVVPVFMGMSMSGAGEHAHHMPG